MITNFEPYQGRKLGLIEVSNEVLDECPDLFESHLPEVTVLGRCRSPRPSVQVGDDRITFVCECDDFELFTNDVRGVPQYSYTFERQPDGTSTHGKPELIR